MRDNNTPTLEAQRRTAAIQKIARDVDFTSDMGSWPDEMVHAYLEGDGDEAKCRAALLRILGGTDV